MEPGRGTTLTATDANGHTSKAVYDELGRVVQAWGPGRDPATHEVPDLEVEYLLKEGEPSAVITRTRGHEDRVETSVALYDGLGRVRQTQEAATGGGRLITDTLYNASGEVWQTNNAYLAEGEPEPVLFFPETSGAVPNATRYTYDGMGRVLTETPVLDGVDAADRRTVYEYGLDHSTVVNPHGTASYRTWTDALGRTSRVDTFTDTTRTAFESIRFTYDSRGQLAKATQDDGTEWSWKYDTIGRVVESTDPDTGTTTTTYDDLDRPRITTDARGKAVWTDYDILSRPTLTRENDSGGKLLGAYSYDQAGGGIGMPYTALRYTDTGNAAQTMISGYTSDYQPTVSSTALPKDLADKYGLAYRYTYTQTYTDTGLPHSTRLPQVGSLPAEEVITRYNEEGLAESVSGHDWYGSQTLYSPYGQVLRSTLGDSPYRVWSTASYDEASGELTGMQTWREEAGTGSAASAAVTGNKVSDTSYAYDAAGNVTSIKQGAAGIRERQCFRYDPVGRLDEAWTSADQGVCKAGGASAATDVAAGEDGTGYWTDYTYAGLSAERTKMVEHDLTGATDKDTTTTYGYGAGDAGPHALTSLVREYTTEAGAKVRQTLQRVYDKAGNTTEASGDTGDPQTLTWTYDGLPETVSGQGTGGRTAYTTPTGACLDLQGGKAVNDTPLQIHACNNSPAQKFTFTPDDPITDTDTGSLRILGDWCANVPAGTAGSAVGVRPCTGSAAQKLVRDDGGHFKHAASDLCLAVKGGSVSSGTDLVLAACDAGSAAQSFTAQDESRYIYAPGGARLLTLKGEQATLHLGEAELSVKAGGAQIDAQRTYAVPGGSILRSAYSGATRLAAITYDHQGSPQAEIALEAGMETRIRKTDPFGQERSTGTNAQKLETHKGFLGATRDDATGYTMLGARLYDQLTGRFLSADPVLDLADPLARGGYAYAHNNPVTFSDPTGLSVSLSQKEIELALQGAGLSSAMVAAAKGDLNRSLTSVILSAAGSILMDYLGVDGIKRCIGGSIWACAEVVLDNMPVFKALKSPGKVYNAVKHVFSAVSAWRNAKERAKKLIDKANAAISKAKKEKQKREEARKKAAQAKKKAAAQKKQTTSNRASQAVRKTGNSRQKSAQASAAPHSSAAASSGAGRKTAASGGSSGKGGSTGASSRSNGGSSGNGGDGKAGGGESEGCNSFVPGTKVLMADGTTKPIEKVKGGDKVIATDEKTGETRVETVTAEIKGKGLKHLVKVTIDTDGTSGTSTAEVTATDGHPFWVPELDQWVGATDLEPGQWLRTSAGTHVQITAIKRWTVLDATVHNLTVTNVHTYYVLARATPVLVHNCNVGSIADGLPARASGDPTVGQVVNIGDSGASRVGAPFKSSHSSSSDDINQFLMDSPDIANPASGPHASITHVETKLAWRMRQAGVTSLDVVINHSGGPCTGKFSCSSAVPAILPQGSSMTVWFRGAAGSMQSVTLHGRARVG